MLTEYLASNDTCNPFAHCQPDDLIVPGVRPSSFPCDATINPALIMGGDHGLLPQHNPSPHSMYISRGSHYQPPPPDPSTSDVTWADHLGYAASASVPSPISPIIGDMDATYGVSMEYCICGCNGCACIPQREYDRQRTDPLSYTDLQEMIVFKVNGKCGYPLKDALRKYYTGLNGRDEKMFTDFKSSISIRVEWLPYGKWTKQIRTLTWKKDPDHITRSKLATEVAKRMKLFFEEMQNKPPVPSHSEYRVQPGIIDLDHLELVALKRVAKSSYMPHFRLISPSQSQSQSQ